MSARTPPKSSAPWPARAAGSNGPREGTGRGKERAGRARRGRAWTSGRGGCQDGTGAGARKGAAGGVTSGQAAAPGCDPGRHRAVAGARLCGYLPAGADPGPRPLLPPHRRSPRLTAVPTRLSAHCLPAGGVGAGSGGVGAGSGGVGPLTRMDPAPRPGVGLNREIPKAGRLGYLYARRRERPATAAMISRTTPTTIAMYPRM